MRRFTARLLVNRAGKELNGITQLLGLDAQLVATARIELRERLAFLAHLAPTARQLLGGGNRYRKVTAVANAIVLRRRSTLRPRATLPPRA